MCGEAHVLRISLMLMKDDTMSMANQKPAQMMNSE